MKRPISAFFFPIALAIVVIAASLIAILLLQESVADSRVVDECSVLEGDACDPMSEDEVNSVAQTSEQDGGNGVVAEPTSTTRPPEPTPEGGLATGASGDGEFKVILHRVEEGQTLLGIAGLYGVTLDDIERRPEFEPQQYIFVNETVTVTLRTGVVPSVVDQDVMEAAAEVAVEADEEVAAEAMVEENGEVAAEAAVEENGEAAADVAIEASGDEESADASFDEETGVYEEEVDTLEDCLAEFNNMQLCTLYLTEDIEDFESCLTVVGHRDACAFTYLEFDEIEACYESVEDDSLCDVWFDGASEEEICYLIFGGNLLCADLFYYES